MNVQFFVEQKLRSSGKRRTSTYLSLLLSCRWLSVPPRCWAVALFCRSILMAVEAKKNIFKTVVPVTGPTK